MIRYSRIRKIHFVGIGGSGMSGVAEVLFNMGFKVSGSDISEGEGTKRLRKKGIKIYLGHDEKNIEGVETLVYSSAITHDNPEVLAAKARRIPVIPRAEMLAELMRMKFSIAVAGTHGKTSTTSMIAVILNEAGKDPTYVVGGRLKIEESGAKLGKSDYLVAEADESDGSFLRLFPTLAVITNIENDHLDYYGSMKRLDQAFMEFGNKVPFYGSVVLNQDCPRSRLAGDGIRKKIFRFGIKERADIMATRIKYSLLKSSFTLLINGQEQGRIQLNCSGRHNVENALAAITASWAIGLDFNTIKSGLKKFSLPERRFQILFYSEKLLVIDDYAHHPSEISATINTLREGDFKRLLVVFQPHRYTRVKILMDEFSRAFQGADEVLLTRLYGANQKAIKNINSSTLQKKLQLSGQKKVRLIEDFNDLMAHLKKDIRPGDAVAFLSAGDLSQLAHQFAREMEDNQYEK